MKPGQVVNHVEKLKESERRAAKLLGPEERLDADDALKKAIIEALREKQGSEWKPGSETYDIASRIIAAQQKRIEHNQMMREMRTSNLQMKPNLIAEEDQAMQAAQNDMFGVIRLAALLCYCAAGLESTSDRSAEMWEEAAESLNGTLMKAEQTGVLEQGTMDAIQLHIDSFYFGLVAQTMFGGEDGTENELVCAGDGRAAAINQASVLSVLTGSPAEAEALIVKSFYDPEASDKFQKPETK